MWTHLNDVVFKGYKSNPITVLAKAHYIFSQTILYNNKANIVYPDVFPGNQLYRPGKMLSKTS